MTVGARFWPIPVLLLLLGASDVARGRAPLFRSALIVVSPAHLSGPASAGAWPAGSSASAVAGAIM